MSDRDDYWRNKPIMISIDRATLHYLANVSKMSQIEVLSSIRDGASEITEKLLNDDSASYRAKKGIFPNTNIAVTYTSNRFFDTRASDKAWHAWQKRQDNYSIELVEVHKCTMYDNKYNRLMTRWEKQNPSPEHEEFDYIKCKVVITNNDVLFNSNEVENLLLEKIFFGGNDVDIKPKSITEVEQDIGTDTL